MALTLKNTSEPVEDAGEAAKQTALEAEQVAEDTQASVPGETKPDAAEAEPKAKPPEKTVPLSALHEERERRKEERKAREAAEAAAARMERRWDEIIRRTAPKAEDTTPSFQEDPAGYLRHQTVKTAADVASLTKWREEQAEVQQEGAARTRFERAVLAEEQTFAAEKPDYPDALRMLQTRRIEDLTAAGVPPADALEVMQRETAFLAHTAMTAGKNPAEVMYGMATRMGYKAATQATAAGKIADIERAQKAASPLSNAGGEGDVEISLARLAEMDDVEFDKNWDKLKKAGKLG